MGLVNTTTNLTYARNDLIKQGRHHVLDKAADIVYYVLTNLDIAVTSTNTTGFRSNATFVPDASRTQYAFSVGNRAAELTVNLGNAASQNFEPFQMNVNLTCTAGAPTSTSTVRVIRARSTHDTTNMPNLRIMNINTYMDVRKHIQAAYGLMSGVDFSVGTITITTESAVGVFNCDCPSGTITGNVRGIIINMSGASLPSTSIGLEVRSDGGAATLTEGIRVWSVGSCVLTTGIKMQGTLTNVFDFTSCLTALSSGGTDCTASSTTDPAYTMKVLDPTGTAGYIRVWAAA